jgi:hypothetical protein
MEDLLDDNTGPSQHYLEPSGLILEPRFKNIAGDPLVFHIVHVFTVNEQHVYLLGLLKEPG